MYGTVLRMGPYDVRDGFYIDVKLTARHDLLLSVYRFR